MMHLAFGQRGPSGTGETEPIPREVVVLHGLGGVGKSTIALEYSFRCINSYSAIFWADATSEASLLQSARGIVEYLVSHYASQGIPYREIGAFLRLRRLLGDDGDIVIVEAGERRVAGALKEWLAVAGNGRWLLIFDNYDDIGAVNIYDLLPTCEAGHVIITSRRSNLQALGKTIEIDEIDEKSGTLLLLKSANKGGANTRGKYRLQAVPG
jgi:hypothetical protein